MKNVKMKLLFFILIIFMSFSCKRHTIIKENKVDIKKAMLSIQPISLSEITSKVSYIPLETTDSSLIGEQANICVFNKYILVASANQNLKLFDRETGKYISEIGHIGIDPQGYAKDPWGKVNYRVDSKKNLVYVLGWKNDWQVYDVENNYMKRIVVEDNARYNLAQSCFFMDGDSIYGQNKLCINRTAESLFVYDCKSESFSTISGLKETPLPIEDLLSVSNLLGNEVAYGGDLQVAVFSGDRKFYTAINSPSLWKFQQDMRVKPSFNDTIYTIRQNRLQPYLIFDLGDWAWAYQDRLNVADCQHKIHIDYVLENENLLYFHFHTGFYTDNKKSYCGIYRKKNGDVMIMEGDQWVDPEYNQALQIRSISNDGNFCSLLTPEILSDELMKQLKVKDDDNPVIALF